MQSTGKRKFAAGYISHNQILWHVFLLFESSNDIMISTQERKFYSKGMMKMGLDLKE